MKILFLANRLPHKNVAGGQRLIFQRLRRLTELGHTIGLAAFVTPENERFIPDMRAMLHEVEAVSIKHHYRVVRAFHDYISTSLPAIFWKNHSETMMRTVGDMVERTRYDVVIAEFGEMGMYLYRNPYLSAVNKVVSCHRCLTTSFSKYAETAGVPMLLRIKSVLQLHVVEKYEFEMYSAMDHILTLTAEDRFTLLNHAPQLPVSVIPPGLDFEYLDHEAKPDHGYPIIMMCGYFADQSNHDGAVWFAQEIWPEIARQHPTLRYYIVGANPAAELKKLSQADDRIRVTGSAHDLRPYREQATIFINPVRLGSGLRIKVLEAMASGLPVVTTSLGAAGIPAQNGVNCFIADTPDLFVESINWLLTDKTLAKNMGKAAHAMVKERYDIRSTIRELEAVLKAVVSIQGSTEINGESLA